MKIRRLFHQMTLLLCAAVLTAGIPAAGAMAKTVKKTVSADELQSGIQFTLKNMPYNSTSGKSPIRNLKIHSVQNFAFSPDGKYVFTVSEGESNGQAHTILVCASLPGAPGADAQAPLEAWTVLENFGHGETITVTASSTPGAYDIWVACTPNGSKTHPLGKDIMRLTCQIINDEVNIIKRVRLNFNDVKPCNIKVYRDRLNVAVDNYVNPGQIAFFIHTTQHGSINGQGSFFQIYDFDRLNTMLEGINNGGVLKMSSKKVKKTLLTEIRCNKIPYNTFQSFDIDGSNLYLCGGHMDKGAMIHKIKYKTNVKTQSITNVTQQIKITPSIFANGRQLGGSELEIEGMKVTSAGGNKVNYFINFFMAKVPISNTISVYKFTK